MKKKALEITLQKIPPPPNPKPTLEQYQTPAAIAADILYFAYSQGNIKDRVVADLGCGTGIFALGAKLLGARIVIGVDIDESSLDVARDCAAKLKQDVEFQMMDVNDFEEECDCVVQNPPFGAQMKHADRPFLSKALEVSEVVYSLHLSKTHEFISKTVACHDAKITHQKEYDFEIRHTFSFHTKEKRYFEVTLYRVQKDRGAN